ncbi:spermidine/putrescine ABC transporter periplasmic substrate-binding protein [Vibrio nigripulchritudo ATCC 27043]|uniref:Putrescine-binding periplasmic protein n=1 Tax=Vibrio nigripulchritudo TaxID=28173 RepID=U4KBU1_9VIBR|nr:MULTISPECIES: extracellular solute-binding protein [Vibrio]EGU60641.1 spermidine/putrescine ABC transporter periplasmic substrate-binding protein [Vibrio nigripulchritudo ATCC 27043]KJY76944.1 spermidine/putrescine ABC transporter substrate-binding protein [Vibrio nigripulchritudo]UAB68784.1 extracellular solute-binding protein [Vibrio sp. SCSIO 43132]CCN70877.1 Spermidine/putrescine-binding periplasmic protein [Vibrio nigripulchritudo SFn118]CCN84160.1 Spermidine/putrescine-binding peripla
MKNCSKLFAGLISAASILSFNASAADEELYFYNWSEYIPSEVLEDFTKETGIKVIYSTYESNESMYAKLKTQGSGYDLVVPSTYFVSKMRKEKMLQKIDKEKLSHFADLDANYLDKPFDPNNDYSIPYIWGATGIGINSDMLDKDSVKSWDDFWDTKWEGQLMMMDDSREVFHIALTKLGYSANTTNPDEIKAAYEELKKLMPNVLVFNSDFPANPYLAGETSLGMLWNGSAYMARQEGATIDIVWPEKGTIFWMDSLAIPSGAKNIEAAHKMIDFLLRPENAAKIAVEIGYPTPVKSAYPLLPKEFANDPSIFPPQEVMDSGEWQDEVGEASTLYEEYFQKLKVNL